MPKSLLRIIALLVIPCLVEGSMNLSGMAVPRCRSVPVVHAEIFANEAVVPGLWRFVDPVMAHFTARTNRMAVAPDRGAAAYAGIPLTWLGDNWGFKLWGIYTRFHWSVIPAIFLLAGQNALILRLIYSSPLMVWNIAILSGIGLLFIAWWPHERAHAWAAKKQGARVKDILITAFGGITTLEPGEFPASPKEEVKFIAVGPLMSFATAALAYLLVHLASFDKTLTMAFVGDLLDQVVQFCLLVGLYSLLPVLPLDGGTLLRSGLWRLFGKQKATAIMVLFSYAAALGSLALAFISFASISSSIGFILIAFSGFVTYMATEEAHATGVLASWVSIRRKGDSTQPKPAPKLEHSDSIIRPSPRRPSLPLIDLLKAFQIRLRKNEQGRFYTAPWNLPEAEWVMDRLRGQELRPIAKDISELAVLNLKYPLEELPLLSHLEPGDSSDGVYLGFVKEIDHPVAIKITPLEPKQLGIIQVLSRLGVYPQLYGVVHLSDGRTGFVLQPGAGSFRKYLKLHHSGEDLVEIARRLKDAGLVNVGQEVLNRSGHLILLDGEDCVIYDAEQFNDFIDRMNSVAPKTEAARRALWQRLLPTLTEDGSPAHAILAALELHKARLLSGPQSHSHSGQTVYRIRTPRRWRPWRPARGTGWLSVELARVRDFDLLVDSDGHLNAIVPVNGRRSIFSRLPPRYLDLTPFVFELPRTNYPNLEKKWMAIGQDHMRRMTRVRTYLATHGLSQILPIERKNFVAYAFMQIVPQLGIPHKEAFEPIDWLSADFREKIMGYIRGTPDTSSIFLPLFPSVYEPSDEGNQENDTQYHGAIARDAARLLGKPEEDILVVGPGTGIDVWIAQQASQKIKLYAVGINPMEVANTRYLAHLAGFEVEAKVNDNILNRWRRSIFGSRRFARVYTNAPYYVAPPRRLYRLLAWFANWSLPFEAYWDGDSGRFMRGLAAGLKKTLQRTEESLAIIWSRDNFPNMREVFAARALRAFILEENDEDVRVWGVRRMQSRGV